MHICIHIQSTEQMNFFLHYKSTALYLQMGGGGGVVETSFTNAQMGIVPLVHSDVHDKMKEWKTHSQYVVSYITLLF